MSHELEFRFAVKKDVPWLARMNRELIRDEGHRNKKSLSDLEHRMSDFLRNEYEVVIASSGRNDIGYVLYRKEPEWLYLRQIFVIDKMRRKGIGCRIIEWLKENTWKDCKRIRTDVLVNNTTGIHFWKAVGFEEYCITMEMENK
jgi:N-acetylglutamate synthase-like GNAT family acetyltransferase